MQSFLSEILSSTQSEMIGYVMIFGLAFFESVAFIGLIVPGTVLVVFSGFLSSQGLFNPFMLFFLVSIAAIMGDALSYYLGLNNKIKFTDNNKLFKLTILNKGKRYFEKHGGKSILLGRFVGWVRPIVPYVAGVFRLDYKKFVMWNVFSGLAWSAVLIAIGYFFGYAWQSIIVWSDRIGILLGVFIFLIILYKIYNKYFNSVK